MRFGERVSVFIFAAVLNGALIVFGLILIFQGAVQKISDGKAEIRDAIVERASDPFSFWFSVGFDAVIGAMLVVAGAYGFWLMFKRKPSSAVREDAG
ncbi:MAG: hypothetical protein ACE37M_15155 [Henriciella sp.]